MRPTILAALAVLLALLLALPPVFFDLNNAYAYPPGVGILTRSKNCLSCHANNGPWSDEQQTIIDIVEANSTNSFRQPDGTFLIQVKRNQPITVRTVVGRKSSTQEPMPHRNAWIYVDPTTIESSSLSKFAPGWETNLQLACRIVGDPLEGHEDAVLTILPMTLRPSDAARDAQLTLQVMLTKGESVKGRAREGMLGNYFERKVNLKVLD